MVTREGEVQCSGAGVEGDFAAGVEVEGGFFDGIIARLGAPREGDERVTLQGSGESWRYGAQ